MVTKVGDIPVPGTVQKGHKRGEDVTMLGSLLFQLLFLVGTNNSRISTSKTSAMAFNTGILGCVLLLQ